LLAPFCVLALTLSERPAPRWKTAAKGCSKAVRWQRQLRPCPDTDRFPICVSGCLFGTCREFGRTYAL